MLTKKNTEQKISAEPHVKTLLETFIQKKKAEYREPSRSNIKRGEPIGLSLRKYEASLWCALTNRPLRDIAKGVGVEYGSLKFYRTEENFKMLQEQHRQEMAQLVISTVSKRIEQLSREVEAYVALEPDQRARRGLPDAYFPELQDSTQYSKELVLMIVSGLEEIMNTFDMEHVQYRMVIYKILTHYFDVQATREIWDDLKESLFFNIHILLAALEEKCPSREGKLLSYYLEVFEEQDGSRQL